MIGEAPMYLLHEINFNFDKYLILSAQLKKARHTFQKAAIQREMNGLAEQNRLLDLRLKKKVERDIQAEFIAAELGSGTKETEPFRIYTSNIL